MPTDPPPTDPQRIQAEALWEALGGDLCICQRADVSHWCEKCQQRLQLIQEAMDRVRAAERQQATAQQAEAIEKAVAAERAEIAHDIAENPNSEWTKTLSLRSRNQLEPTDLDDSATLRELLNFVTMLGYQNIFDQTDEFARWSAALMHAIEKLESVKEPPDAA